MNVRNLSALTFTSTDPARLAAFYSEGLGIPFVLQQHGTLHAHHECDWAGIHYAILPFAPNLDAPVTPVFRATDLGAAIEAAVSAGARLKFKPLSLGKGMTVVGLTDPDGNAFRLIHIGE
ncbi:MAG: hypothetical protein LJE67_15035 [Salaquimonas sp.]|nr:hypothetical protein [Salaquimonas sp.]